MNVDACVAMPIFTRGKFMEIRRGEKSRSGKASLARWNFPQLGMLFPTVPCNDVSGPSSTFFRAQADDTFYASFVHIRNVLAIFINKLMILLKRAEKKLGSRSRARLSEGNLVTSINNNQKAHGTVHPCFN